MDICRIKNLKPLVEQICILGPLAGMCGGDIEQERMHLATGTIFLREGLRILSMQQGFH